jgi:hypothetical protein
VLARYQSISSSDGFQYIAKKLQEHTYELHSAINLAFPENTESRRTLDDLSRNWVNFSDTWAKFTVSPNIVGTGIFQREELTALLSAVIELHKPIAVLLDQTRLQPGGRPARYTRPVAVYPPPGASAAGRAGH